MSQITGSLISSVRDSCRNGLLDWSPRLMLAMYSCEIQCSSMPPCSGSCLFKLTDPPADVLGKVYGVVAKRRGRIVAEEMKEGTSFFSVSALLPVAESFGFADGECAVNVIGGGWFGSLVDSPRYPDEDVWRCEPTTHFLWL